MLDESALLRLGYAPGDVRRLAERAGGRLEGPDDVRRVLDGYDYLGGWRERYVVQSVRSSLHGARLTCIDAAILSYGLLELLPGVSRRLLAIHRRAPSGEECGHLVTLYWGPDGRVGALSKSSFAGLDHREARYPDPTGVAESYARAYLRLGFEPLYFGVTTLEEAAGDVDWRFHPGALNVLSERIQARYEYAFESPRPRPGRSAA